MSIHFEKLVNWHGKNELIPKLLCSAAVIAWKGRQDFYLGSDGGLMIPVHSKIDQEMRMHFERLVNWYGR